MSTPPQALFVSYTSQLGGAESILLDHATALPAPIALACPEGPLAERARAAGIDVTTIAARPIELRASIRDRLATPLRIAAQARELRRLVTELQPRRVIAWGMRPLLSCTAALGPPRPRRSDTRPPLVFQHNDLLPSPLVGRAIRAAARRSQLTLALSRAIADDLQRTDDLPIEILHPGVDLHRFHPPPNQDAPRASESSSGAPGGDPPGEPTPRPEQPEELDIPRSGSQAERDIQLPRRTTAPRTTAPTALLLGAIVPWKRPHLALDTIALATRALPDLRLRIAGAPLAASGHALLADLRRRAAQPDLAGHVDFAGHVEDVPAALRDATCLLHCADREPYGMALVEALACGRPVVAPAAGGPLEIVDSTCGVLYPPGDTAAVARALVDVIGRAEELGPSARARAETHFDHAGARARFAELVMGIAP